MFEGVRYFVLLAGAPNQGQRFLADLLNCHQEVAVAGRVRLESLLAPDTGREDLLGQLVEIAAGSREAARTVSPKIIGRAYDQRILRKMTRGGESWTRELLALIGAPLKIIQLECDPRRAVASIARKDSSPVHVYQQIQQANALLAQLVPSEDRLLLHLESDLLDGVDDLKARLAEFLGLEPAGFTGRARPLKASLATRAPEYAWTQREQRRLERLVNRYDWLAPYRGRADDAAPGPRRGLLAGILRKERKPAREITIPLETIRTYLMFIGYPRSGHSIIGALIDAHPNALVASEYGAWTQFRKGMARDELLQNLADNSALKARRGRAGGNANSPLSQKYDYQVPGMFQGRYEALYLIGDKQGGGTSKLYERYPGLLGRFRRYIGLPLKVIHVIRNPLDNIATLARVTDDPAGRYAAFAQANDRMRRDFRAGELLEIYQEDFTADPRAVLEQICRFLGLEPDDDYLASCCSIVHESSSRRREQRAWREDELEQALGVIERYDWLGRYREEATAFTAYYQESLKSIDNRV